MGASIIRQRPWDGYWLFFFFPCLSFTIYNTMQGTYWDIELLLELAIGLCSIVVEGMDNNAGLCGGNMVERYSGPGLRGRGSWWFGTLSLGANF